MSGSAPLRAKTPRPGTPVVVFDLDGVLTHGDSLTALLLPELLDNAWTFVRAIPPVAAALCAGRRLDRRTRAVSRLTELAFEGRSLAQVDAAARALGRRWAGSSRRVHTAGLERLLECIDSGARVVIATATIEGFAATFLREVGAGVDRIVASGLRTTAAGAISLDQNLGERKAAALRELAADLEGATLYTDSSWDLPTARMCAATILVGASLSTRRRYAAAGVHITGSIRRRR